MGKIEVHWWKCPECKAQFGTPTAETPRCNNCGTTMEEKKLEEL